jgi:hypothetical protein
MSEKKIERSLEILKMSQKEIDSGLRFFFAEFAGRCERVGGYIL